MSEPRYCHYLYEFPDAICGVSHADDGDHDGHQFTPDPHEAEILAIEAEFQKAGIAAIGDTTLQTTIRAVVLLTKLTAENDRLRSELAKAQETLREIASMPHDQLTHSAGMSCVVGLAARALKAEVTP